MTYPTTFDGPWRAENLGTLRALERSLEERVEPGNASTRLPLQVVVAFIAELERPPTAAASDI